MNSCHITISEEPALASSARPTCLEIARFSFRTRRRAGVDLDDAAGAAREGRGVAGGGAAGAPTGTAPGGGGQSWPPTRRETRRRVADFVGDPDASATRREKSAPNKLSVLVFGHCVSVWELYLGGPPRDIVGSLNSWGASGGAEPQEEAGAPVPAWSIARNRPPLARWAANWANRSSFGISL